jgi:phosphoribosylformylglycinamidine (FGAM) synthase-like enzyme
MPKQQVEQPLQIPSPATITPALLKTHSITADEYKAIESKLGRTPSLTELGIFSVMWSEHCSYKSSRVHLKRLPTKGTRLSGPGSVVQGPGENAGIIDVGDGWACAFKIESHNHPSYIEPYQGAATGVGGILRDIFTMNARPLAVMDSLRFGPLDEAEPDAALRAKNHQITRGVVHGVAGYGNCFGVPNLGGETRFEACYSGNPLLNAFALGLVKIDEIFYAKATGVGNPVLYVGAKTGRDGIHGATMASEEFTEGSEQKRPNVQMGDPFLEKLLLEACLEAMATGAVLGIQDMGAAGLTCSTCEMGARGELGVSIELDLVPQRETGMSSYEIMLSESQERMLLVADKGREGEVLAVFAKWGLDCSIVGTVTADDVMRVRHHGELVAEIPNKALTDEAPLYHRPVGVWNAPVPKEAPAWVLEELKMPRDYTADLKKLLASANICDKRWIFEQYDSMVQTNTVQGPGGEAGVMRIKGSGPKRTPEAATSTVAATPDFVGAATLAAPAEGLDGAAVEHSIVGKLLSFVAASTPQGEAILLTGNEDAANPVVAPDATHESGAPGSAATRIGDPTAKPERGLAMALAGNGRWCYLDPKLGAMHAVAEAARKVACTGATPVSATNCLNFGNPEKPEIMAQLSAAIDGISEACIALETPVTGGNVSLYNETRGEGIYPTPVIGIVGIIDDVSKSVPSSFQQAGDDIILLMGSSSMADRSAEDLLAEFGSSDFAKTNLGAFWGRPPQFNVQDEAALHRVLQRCSAEGIATSASDISDGGLAVTLAKSTFRKNIGATLFPYNSRSGTKQVLDLFSETSSAVVLTCKPGSFERIEKITEEETGLIFAQHIGVTGGSRLSISYEDAELDVSIADLRAPFSTALESQLAAEVLL